LIVERLQELSADERAVVIAAQPERLVSEIVGHWWAWARPDQRLPDGDWTYWLILAGRGYGKTRTGAETVRQWIADGFQYVNLIGATADDARDIMVQGESGILAICPRRERPEYKPSQRALLWPNGAKSLIFTADEPERLRGKQHEKLWADELAAWRYAESWDQAKFGLRLGIKPQAVATTTPRPTAMVRALLADSATHVTRGNTADNRANLAPSFFDAILKRYEGTRLGRQEIDGELLDDNPNALFTVTDIDRARVRTAPELQRIVVAIDPAATSGEESDETGIAVAGVNGDHGYVLADRALRASPEKWARRAIEAYYEFKADRIVAESNNGGEMVASVIRSADANVPVKLVTASRGKAIRAEPVSALYEQGRVHHVGSFPALEDQMTQFDPSETSQKSPDRMDALVWAVTELMCTNRSTGILDYLTAERERVAATRETDTHGATFRRD
jgi:phage terminase large subunit-like protein